MGKSIAAAIGAALVAFTIGYIIRGKQCEESIQRVADGCQGVLDVYK